MADVRPLLIALALVSMVACRAPTGPSQSVATLLTVPTRTPGPLTATPQPDYRGMRTRLIVPLGALIVAVRGNDRPQAAVQLASFNAAAEPILASIASDTSKPANVLHSAITNVRAHPGDQAALEQIRLNLIDDIP